MEFGKNLELTDEQLESVNGGLTIIGGSNYAAVTSNDAAQIYGAINGFMQFAGITATDPRVSGVIGAESAASFKSSLLATGLVTNITDEEASLLFTHMNGMLFKSAGEIEAYLKTL